MGTELVNIKKEIINIVNECYNEHISENKIEENEKVVLDIMKEVLVANILNQTTTEDNVFVMQNLKLYKNLIKATLKLNENEIIKHMSEILKAKNEYDVNKLSTQK